MEPNRSFSESQTTDVTISVVAPFFNEADCILAFCDALRAVMDGMPVSYEVILVNDGSQDNSRQLLDNLVWPECTVLDLAENYGHQRALEAGLSRTIGEFVVTMDSDLQHPPQLIPTLYETARDRNVDVVYAVRENSVSNSFVKQLLGQCYYRIVDVMTPFPVSRNAADFRLITRKVYGLLRDSASPRAFRVLIPSLRMPSAEVSFNVEKRFGGESKYSIKHQFRLALLSVLVSPSRWLRLCGLAGLTVMTIGILELVIGLIRAVQALPSDLLFVGSIITICVGLQLSLLAFGIEYLIHLLSARIPNQRFIIAKATPLS